MYRGKIIHKKAIYTRLSTIWFMHDMVKKLVYPSQNRVNFAYTNDMFYREAFLRRIFEPHDRQN